MIFKKYFEILDIDYARNRQYFSSKSAVYFWYFPIELNHNSGDINESINDFFNSQFKLFCQSQQITLRDRTKKYINKVQMSEEVSTPLFQEEGISDKRLFSKKLSELFLFSSIFSRPLYIGRSSREHGVSSRIQEHLNGTTTFSTQIIPLLREYDISMADLIILVIDLDRYSNDYLSGCTNDQLDLSQEIELFFINLFKPVYNLKY